MKSALRGFTTIELVTTLAIAAIIMGLAIHHFIDQTPHRQLKEASLTLVGELRLARQKAIADGGEITISFQPALKKYLPVIGEQTLPTHVRFGILDEMKKATQCGRDKSIGGYFGDSKNDKIIFHPDGTISAGTVYLKNETEAAAIVINITGRIKQCWWSGNGWRG
jgi:Tfp pilus assembly protein FimT